MFKKALLPDTLRAIKLVSKIKTVRNAYLAGGTALALHLGHRISVDLDFFTNIKFNEQALSLELSRLSTYKEEGKSWQTVWGNIGETKFSIFYYKKYGVLDDHYYSIVRALSYFEDAEQEKYTPKMLKTYDWEEIKKFFS